MKENKLLTAISSRDQIYHKLGRCICTYQQVELLYKHYLKFRYIAKDFGEELKGANSHDKATLGNVVSEFFEKPKEVKKHLTFSYEIEYVDEELRKRQLEALVEKRNYLVHHFILDWDGDCEESCKEVLGKLSQYHEEARVELKGIQATLKHIEEAARTLNDPLIRARLLNPNFNALYELATIRPKEWISLGEAGKYISNETGVCFTKSPFRNGFKKLSDFIEDSSYFTINRIDGELYFKLSS